MHNWEDELRKAIEEGQWKSGPDLRSSDPLRQPDHEEYQKRYERMERSTDRIILGCGLAIISLLIELILGRSQGGKGGMSMVCGNQSY